MRRSLLGGNCEPRHTEHLQPSGLQVIHKALGRMGFPPYIRWIMHWYLGGRVLYLCEDDQRFRVTKEATYDVPQDYVHRAAPLECRL